MKLFFRVQAVFLMNLHFDWISSNERHSIRFDYTFHEFECNSKSVLHSVVFAHCSMLFVASIHDNQTWCDWSNCKYSRIWLIERLILQLAKIKCDFKIGNWDVSLWLVRYHSLVRWLFLYIDNGFKSRKLCRIDPILTRFRWWLQNSESDNIWTAKPVLILIAAPFSILSHFHKALWMGCRNYLLPRFRVKSASYST